ncbi:DUF4116 domain-containing protein [Candidatus Protochlamydia phocaeensis]|uniref:DUF4116 domain-containing protein n=1 Tax=Candidatus Protochlamydia phocaeensis TaxID=1414722 RepID=UPI00083843AC|nr:DUF4116 domain-containing protein [Candidatus Protochlamydia phocaeensis]
MRQDPFALQQASDHLKNSIFIVDAAVERDGLALEFAGPNAKDHSDTVLKAVRQNPLALPHASDRLRNNAAIVLG